jgi:hypothetical protein
LFVGSGRSGRVLLLSVLWPCGHSKLHPPYQVCCVDEGFLYGAGMSVGRLASMVKKHNILFHNGRVKNENKYTGCPRMNVQDMGRVFLMLKYTDIAQNTYVQS